MKPYHWIFVSLICLGCSYATTTDNRSNDEKRGIMCNVPHKSIYNHYGTAHDLRLEIIELEINGHIVVANSRGGLVDLGEKKE